MSRLRGWRAILGPVLGGAVALSQVSGAAWGLAFPDAQYLPSQGILKVPRPRQLDAAIINLIADVGAKQLAWFPPYSDVAGFIARKCGTASLAVTVHPQYLAELNARNERPGGTELLQSSPVERTLKLPACARFVSNESEFDAPKGIAALAKELELPFEERRFQRIARAQNVKAVATREYYRLVASPYQDAGPCRASDLVSFFGCVNAIETAYFNRDRIGAGGRIEGKVRMRAAPKGEARVAIAKSKASSVRELAQRVESGEPGSELTQYKSSSDIDNLEPTSAVPTMTAPAAAPAQAIPGVEAITVRSRIPAAAGKPVPKPATACRGAACAPSPPPSAAVPAVITATVENEVTFVKAVGGIDKYGPDCAKAHEINAGRWPFDPAEFKRALRLGGQTFVKNEIEFPRLLIVDSGFDFTYDEGRVPPEPERSFFPKHHFAPNTIQAPDTREDTDEDGIGGNFNFAGVNLAERRPSSETSTADDPFRSHGLSVTALALGGRDLQDLRTSKALPIAVGIASMVPVRSTPAPLNRGDLERIVQYATANKVAVVNMSLSTPDQLQGFRSEIKTKAQRLVFVAAAGNEDAGKALHEAAAYPAALGGKSGHDNRTDPVIITVGAHDGRGQLAGFSNFGNSKVDVLAPGCMVPSYELQREDNQWVDPPRAKEALVTGTSFATPIVSFLVTLLKNHSLMVLPGDLKERILVGTNFDFRLRDAVYSSGTINPAKVLGFQFDVLETSNDGQRRIRYGAITNRNAIQDEKIECAGETIGFRHVKKLAYDRDRKRVVVMWNRLTIPIEFERRFCDESVLSSLSYEFTDRETGENLVLPAKEILDYIPKH